MHSRKTSSVFLAVFLCAGIFLFAAPSAWSQAADAGTISGQVIDPSLAAIAGAEVRITDPSTGLGQTVTTNEVGRYIFVSVPPAVYDVTFTKAGFNTGKLTGQKVDIGEVLTLDITLRVGAIATTVEVPASAGAELQTLNATVGETLTNTALNLMPNLSRDVSTLASLQVGVSLAGNVSGAALDQNKVLVDGGNNTDDMAGGGNNYVPGNGYAGSGSTGGTPTGVLPTPVESVEEFKVSTMGQTADFGGAAGSEIQMVTKRGTNSFHGAAYEYYFANNVGAANLWRNNHTPSAFYGTPYTPLPSTHRNRYGGALGGPLAPKFLGSKTYFFVNYEAMRYPFATTYEGPSPTATYRAGVILLPTATGNQPFNINPNPVTVNGVTYPACGATNSCDPRGLGVNPLIQQIWNTMPLPNDPSFTGGTPGDGYGNSGGYLAPISLPQNSDFIVGRIDHDFGQKNRFMVSYRDYDFHLMTSNQVDVSGILGGQAGHWTATAPRAVKPSYWVAGLTTSINTNMTNTFRFSFIRNFWQWFTDGGVPQLPGLGGVVEIGGETVTSTIPGALVPYNVNTQNTRQRFWDGKDFYLTDSISHLRGNHLIQYGGTYQRNNDLHSRNDNGVTIDNSITYLAAMTGTGVPTAIPASAFTLPPGVTSGALSSYETLLAQATGMLAATQLMYTRSGPQLTLNSPGQFAYDHSIIPSYEAFAADTWHLKPHVTLTYGLTYELEMPPYELSGKQVQMVDAAGNPIDIKGYLTNRKSAALQGQVYEPEIGFALIGNAGGGEHKYPYNPFYGGFSPHGSLAWNPSVNNGILGKIFGGNKTVIRGGYARIYGRLNGVDLMLVPLLGPGLLQGVQCIAPLSNGTCAGTNGATPVTAFRIGVDGNNPPLPSPSNPTATVSQTLPQPFFPGAMQNGILNPGAVDGSQIDPRLKPNHSDEVTFTIQRSLNQKMMIEAGYIGRKIGNEFQEINIDAVPTMTTLGGQSFAQAYGAAYTEYCGLQGTTAAGVTCNKNTGAVTPQPFFEAAMGGPKSAYCSGFSSCTAAVVSNEGSNLATIAAQTLWLDLGKSSSWVLGRTMLEQSLGTGLNSQLTGAFDFINSYGHSNYNAGFVTLKTNAWHGFTTQSNFTYGRALGTGAVTQASSSITVPNPFDFNKFGTYGPQPFDVKFTYTLLLLYQEPWFASQKGVLGHVLGGWSLAPLFTARSGLPLRFMPSSCDCQAFGEIYTGQSANYENAVPAAPYTGSYTGEGFYNFQNGSATIGSSGNPAKGGSGINIFQNPAQIASEFRPLVLGVDTNTTYSLRGFPFWNLDATLSKQIRVTERVDAKVIIQFVNLLNHFVPLDPTLNIQSLASFGAVTNQYTTGNGVQSRWMEFGLRLGF